jgi:hypothetical protein
VLAGQSLEQLAEAVRCEFNLCAQSADKMLEFALKRGRERFDDPRLAFASTKWQWLAIVMCAVCRRETEGRELLSDVAGLAKEARHATAMLRITCQQTG